jgi:hypothetical protein
MGSGMGWKVDRGVCHGAAVGYIMHGGGSKPLDLSKVGSTVKEKE